MESFENAGQNRRGSNTGSLCELIDQWGQVYLSVPDALHVWRAGNYSDSEPSRNGSETVVVDLLEEMIADSDKGRSYSSQETQTCHRYERAYVTGRETGLLTTSLTIKHWRFTTEQSGAKARYEVDINYCADKAVVLSSSLVINGYAGRVFDSSVSRSGCNNASTNELINTIGSPSGSSEYELAEFFDELITLWELQQNVDGMSNRLLSAESI